MIDLKKIIQNLQEIDLNKIDLNVDLKTIDMQSIQNNLLKRKDILINTVIILATLFVVNGIFSNQKKESRNIENQIKELEEKSIVIKTYEAREKKLNEFLEKSQKGYLGATAVINAVSEIAQSRDIKILSFVPDKLKTFDDYTEQTVKFIFSGSFENALRFVHKIETYENNFRIDMWRKEDPTKNTFEPQEIDDDFISWEMIITSINLKQDKE